MVSAAIFLLVSGLGISFGGGGSIINMQTTRAIEQQQAGGRITGDGTSEVPRDVCDHFPNNDFLTIQFHASFLLSPDGKTGKVTTGSGILDTTYSNVFGYLSITGGTVDMSVHPALYLLRGTASFQSSPSSSCNLPSAVKFTIAKPDGSQLKCGNTDLITFNSFPLTGSVTGNVNCTATTTIVAAVGKDQTHPLLTLPSAITTEATGPTGATVTYSVSATESEDGSITPSCSPTSDTAFALGTTTVTCAATDKGGLTATGTFTVTVQDTTAPVLTLPSDITTEATDPTGARVTYTATATDLVDGSVPVTCNPASGSLFAIGLTTVTCSATDAHGNTASETFTVTVIAPTAS